MTLLFGAGNFQRAFAAWMMQRLNATAHPVGPATVVRVTDHGRYDALEAAGWRYPVWTRGLRDGHRVDEAEWVDVIDGAVYPYEDFGAYLALAERSDVHTLISNTTEAGIAFEEEVLPRGAPAKTFPGKLAQWLHARWQWCDGHPERGVDVLPCELIEANGQRLRGCVEQYADHWGFHPEFKAWLGGACAWMNTLVDRIVPGAPSAEVLAQAQLPADVKASANAVTAEPYHFLAVENAGARFRENWPFAAAGLNVDFVDELTPARTLKVRLLNGAHTAMVPVGLRHGVETVRAFVEDTRWEPWLRGLLPDEIAPTLYGKGGAGLERDAVEAYAKTVLERFGNPFVEHRLESILLNSFSKWPTRLGETVRHYVSRGEPVPDGLCFAWDCQLALARERGAEGVPDDHARVLAVLEKSPSLEDFVAQDRS